MKLLDLLKHINVFNVKNNHKIENITDSSESCTLNSIFVAIKGHKEDGNNFIDEAITKGAKTIVLSKRIKEQADINYIYVDDTKRIFAVLLYYFNEKYLNKVKLIGVVGTNGKSTTANNIFSMLNYFHRKASLIGTDGFIIEDKVIKHNNTTPHIFLLYEYIKMCVKNNVKYIVMELSSVAIAELRCHMLEYFILVFTNFNEDHLDYHKTIDDYFLHKRIPFIEMNKNSYAIINKDDSKYNSLIKHIKGRVISYSIKEESMYKAFILSYKAFMISFSVNNCNYIYNSIGIFNIYNLLPLFFINDLLNIDKDMFKTFIYNLKPPKGRMDVIKYKKSYIVVDYAHTESSVRNVINTVLGFPHNKIYVVIGCGGSRDKNKREKIGRILSRSQVEIILTSDNPRYERPMAIIADIASGITTSYIQIENRKEAILYGIRMLKANDYLLVIGKGNEDYIEINGNRIPHNDYEVINEAINNKI